MQETGKNIYVDYFGSQFYFGQFDPSLLCEYVLIAPARQILLEDDRTRRPLCVARGARVAEFPEDRLSREFLPRIRKGPTSACGRGIIRIAL